MKNKMLSYALGGAALAGLVFFVPVSKAVAEEDTRPACMGYSDMVGGDSSNKPPPCKSEKHKVIEAPAYESPREKKSGPSVPFRKYGDLSTRLVGTYAQQKIPALDAIGEEPPELLEERRSSERKWGPALAGYTRDLPEEVKHDALAGLPWQQQPDGSITAVRRVRSEGAKELRLKMKIAPEFNGELRFAPTSNPSDAVGPIPRFHWERMEIYWAPTIDGDDILIEIRMPDGKIPPAGVIGFNKVSHLYEWLGAGDSVKNVKDTTKPCHNEVACAKTVAERWASRATALIRFSAGNDFFSCDFLN
ncbi:MAG: hypothetical protein FWD77_12145 [Betaproteobacteria bacterium]|nr:hypothetical protein [Betaproteobacteria bacterium]